MRDISRMLDRWICDVELCLKRQMLSGITAKSQAELCAIRKLQLVAGKSLPAFHTLVCSGLLLMLLAWRPSAFGAPALHEGRDFSAGGCYAHFTGTELTLGNSHVRRRWRIDRGHLFATSLFDMDRRIEWLNLPSSFPSPSPPVEAAGDDVVLRGGFGNFGYTEAKSLRVEAELKSGGVIVDYEFQIFPDAAGARMWVIASGVATNSQSSPAVTSESARPVTDDLENLEIVNPHIRLIQVSLRDRTDEHNELVFENEWLLHPNEATLQLKGNLFVLENTLTGDGLIFLKEAPEPEMRPIKSAFDLWFSGSRMSNPGHGQVKTAQYYRFSFTGNGFNANGKGYSFALMTYHGGRTGRIAALQLYQRQIRQYVPDRDGQLVSNTWGDRSLELKLNESFIEQEIDAGKKLGVDIVQIDGGWQSGRTRGLSSAGVWEGFWKTSSNFWQPDVVRFPHGLTGLSNYAKSQGMKLGLWYAPDSYDGFSNWQRDADQILSMYRNVGVEAFKLDSVKILSKQGEANYYAVLNRILSESDGKILLNLDLTAETRQGYFGDIAAGPLFVENRYTDWHSYWPHQTLRNFWKLAQYVDPVRLQMEFLNSERNQSLYVNDPLAPAEYTPDCLFATVMFSSPLAWFETSGVSPHFAASLSPLVAQWKKERVSIYEGITIPIGEVPDGVAWTGFASVGKRDEYLLIFRELNPSERWTVPQAVFPKQTYRILLLGGQGQVKQTTCGFAVTIPEKLGFVWVKLDPVD
jgi:alpha-galactosidase